MVAVQVLLQFLRLGWFAIMAERLGSLVRIIAQIFSDSLYFLFLLGASFPSQQLPVAANACVLCSGECYACMHITADDVCPSAFTM